MLNPAQVSALQSIKAPTGGMGSSASSNQPMDDAAFKSWLGGSPSQSASQSSKSPSTGIDMSGLFSPTSTDTGARIVQDVKDTGTNIKSAIQGTGDFAGKSTLNRATGAVSEAASLPLKAASEALPSPVRSGISAVGNAAGSVVNLLGEKIGNVKALQDWTQAHPDAANALADIAGTAANTGNIAGNILAVGGATEGVKMAAPKVGSAVEGVAGKANDMISNVAGKVSSIPEKVAPVAEKVTSLTDAADIVSPKMTAKDTANALAQGRGVGGGLLSKTKIAPDAMTQDIANAAQGIVKKGVPASKNIANLRQALSTEAQTLKSQIETVDHPYSFKELNAKLNNVETPISIKGTAFEKQIGAVKQAAMKIAKDNGGTVSSLLDARKGFDALVSKEYPNLYESASAPMKTAITSIRNTINDFIEENLPDNVSFKDSLNKQSLYYRAIDNIAEKAVGETRTTGLGRMGDMIRKHPVGALVTEGLGLEGARKIITGHF